MSRSLHVLLTESHPGLADLDAGALEAAGHHVHRCHDPRATDSFPCAGLHEGGDCPLDGPVDVAVLHRLPSSARPTPWEDGARCAVRAGVPLVVHPHGSAHPYRDVATEVPAGGSVVDAVAQAADQRWEALRAEVLRRTDALQRAARLEPGELGCEIEADGPDLVVHLSVPADAPAHLDHALAVRVLDAVRATCRGLGRVDVAVRRRA